MIEHVHLKSVAKNQFSGSWGVSKCGHELKFVFLCHIMNLVQQAEGALQFLGAY